MKRKSGGIFLLIAAIIWGFGLVAQQEGMDVMGPWSFTAVRCTLGGVSMIPLVAIIEKRKLKRKGYNWLYDTKKCIKPAFLCAVLLLGTMISQQYGLLYTSVGKSAFITAFYIFLTPLIGLLLKKKVEGKIWFATALAMVGLYMITMTGGLGSINRGDMIMLMAALSYTLFIHAADRYGDLETIKLSCMQFLFIGLISFLVAPIIEPGDITWNNYVISIVPIFYTGIIAAAGGYTFQMIGQKNTEANVSSLILSSETLFSLFAGWICLGEVLRPLEYVGCAIIVIAIVIAVVPKTKS